MQYSLIIKDHTSLKDEKKSIRTKSVRTKIECALNATALEGIFRYLVNIPCFFLHMPSLCII